jgi:uncharacterized Zn-finger protein
VTQPKPITFLRAKDGRWFVLDSMVQSETGKTIYKVRLLGSSYTTSLPACAFECDNAGHPRVYVHVKQSGFRELIECNGGTVRLVPKQHAFHHYFFHACWLTGMEGI